MPRETTTPSARPPRKAAFTLTELITAMALLAMLMGWYYTALAGLHRLETVYGNENEAVILLNNVVVRLEAGPALGESRVRGVLEDEFRRSRLAAVPGLAPSCARGRGRLTVAVLKANGRPLARLEIAE